MHSNILIIIINITVLLVINCECYYYYFYYDSKPETWRWLNETGYPYKRYTLTTKDSYILTLHRMPNPGKPPVLLMDGIIPTSLTYLFQGPESALAYMLFNSGYDVWLGNTRGSKYSQRHEKYDKKDEIFWKYEFENLALYDLPVFIDKTLNVTGYETLAFIGNSRSYTTFLILATLKPEYNIKISKAILMNPLNRYVDKYANVLPYFEDLRTFNYYDEADSFIEEFCSTGYISDECKFVIYTCTGLELDTKFMPITKKDFKNLPAGVTYLELRRHAMALHTYGNLSFLTTPVVTFYNCDDYSSPAWEVRKVVFHSAGPTDVYEIIEPEFRRNDFLWGHKAADLVYNIIIQELAKPVNEERSRKHVHRTVRYADQSRKEVIIEEVDKTYKDKC